MRTPLSALLSCAVAAAPVCVAQASAPAGGEERRLAVLPLRVEGAADETTRREWTGGLRRGVARGDAAIVDQAQVDKLGDASCDRKQCWEKLRKGTQATHIVRTSVTIKNRDYAIRLELVSAEDGAVIVSTEERCEICGVEEVANLLDSQGALLQTRLSSMGKGPPVLVIDTKPSGALVYVDGEVVGETPLERAVAEGSHKVRVSLAGHVAEERELSFVPGVREQVTLDLQRTPGNPKRRVLGGVAVGGGIVLLGVAAGLLTINPFPYKNQCSGSDVDADGDCRYLFDMRWGGAALAAAGASLVTLGIVALLRNRKPKMKKAEQAFVLPAGLGVVGRF